ncbi:MAG: DUF3500 domain-containing protein [Chitinophagaceae bacterium]|nr:DUF3500 domain-containing protein [Chitinophagaceae bacterium]
MKRIIGAVCCVFFLAQQLVAQEILTSADNFIRSLSAEQKTAALYPFDTEERYNFQYVPRERKGLPIGDLNAVQRKAAMDLVRTCLSEQAARKVEDIISLEYVLKAIEHRGDEDHYRDARKYYFTIFGLPGEHTVWGWRIEGHHVAFNFSVKDKKLLSGTPGFLGANPAVIKEGPEKGKQVLKDETDMGFAMIGSLSPANRQKAILSVTAPNEIITTNTRKAILEHPAGVSYAQMSDREKQQLLQLISLYVHRFTKSFAEDMLKDIQAAGLENLSFAWAGTTEPAEGKANYYLVHGPTIIIEYDNSQNNANHVHTVVRDLKHDFGGDALLEHYRTAH